ncbi:MAG: replicative DNA helicase [Ignavibacteria bacterium]|nr:replicative DNA helicase [Ignavibacteria bacterium]
MAKNKIHNLKLTSQNEVHGGRIPPHSRELEQAVLGTIIMNNSLIDNVAEILKPEHFYLESSKIIYSSIIDLWQKKSPVDLLTLTENLRVRNELESAGGVAYLAELTHYYGTMESVVKWCEDILNYWIRRELIRLTYSVTEKSYEVGDDIRDILDETERNILDITGYLQRKNYVNLKDMINDTMSYVEDLHERNLKGTTLFGVPSGYKELDKLTGGFQNSELIVIAGRPSHGKTALALNFARNAAVDHKKNIGIFSIEMSLQEIAMRFICLESRVDLAKLKTGSLPESDWQKISKNTPKLVSKNLNILVDDSSPLDILELRSKARRMKYQHNVDMIIIDYLQLMDVKQRGMERHLEIAQITRGLKQLAKELNIPVIALSQLSRKVEDRAGKEKRPQLSDLRESGAIEQDADVVIFINRPEVYMSKDDPKYSDYHGLAEVIVGKQRNGPIGMAKLTFIHSYTKFENRAPEPEFHITEPF